MSNRSSEDGDRSGCTLEGWLYKWTNFMKGYKKRWFILDGTNLSYYRAPDEITRAPRGMINLLQAKIKSLSAYNFTITSNGGAERFQLKASSESEKQQWLTAFENAKSQHSCPDESSTIDKQLLLQRQESSFECTICLEPARDAVVTFCGHMFCSPCLELWLEAKPFGQVCPVCKAAICRKEMIRVYGGNSAVNTHTRENGNQLTLQASQIQAPLPNQHLTKLISPYVLLQILFGIILCILVFFTRSIKAVLLSNKAVIFLITAFAVVIAIIRFSSP